MPPAMKETVGVSKKANSIVFNFNV